MYDLASVKRWLNITVDTFDADLTALMGRALDTVQLELDWYFGESRMTQEIIDGSGTRALWLRQPPLETPVVYYRIGVGEVWRLVSTDDYEWDQRGLFNVGNWVLGHRLYRIVYPEGFAEMPGDIEQLLLDLVALKWNRRGTDPGLKSERIGDYNYTRGDLEESQYWQKVIMRWRRGRI